MFKVRPTDRFDDYCYGCGNEIMYLKLYWEYEYTGEGGGGATEVLTLCRPCWSEMTLAVAWEPLYSAFCMSWISIAYAAVIGRE